MDLIPYELIQQIASWLLPKHQCRLALASKWCYQWLYNDLLKWHARKYKIFVPTYKTYPSKHGNISVINTSDIKPNIIIIDSDNPYLYITNMTKKNISVFCLDGDNYNHYDPQIINTHRVIFYQLKSCRKFDILAGYYPYIHKDILLTYFNVKQPIYSLEYEIVQYLYGKISISDRINFDKGCYCNI